MWVPNVEMKNGEIFEAKKSENLAYLLSINSLKKNFPTIKQKLFWMTFPLS